MQTPCPLRSAALASPDAPAIVSGGVTLSYQELDLRVSAASHRLTELGCEAGSRVALYLSKDESYVVLLLALLRSGSVACPVSTRVPPDGVTALLRKAGCKVLVSDDEELLEVVDSTIQKLRPETVLRENAAGAAPQDPETVVLDQPATIVFTSGSTGTPKAALHTFGNHYYSALGSNTNITLAPGDRWLHSLPLYHVGGLSILFRCLLAGATISLPDTHTPLGEAIVRYGATHISLVATQLQRLLNEGANLSSLKAILMGGGPMPDRLVDEAFDHNLPIHTSYGLTEMASQVTTTSPGADAEELHASGRVLPNREVSISEEGEILVRGATLFAGYVEGADIERARDKDGWFHTKDLGTLEADGSLRVRGRRDNLFISGGENIQPEEIEDALGRIEGVEQAVVVPILDEEFGERPVAFVQTVSGTLDPRYLAKELEPILPRFKIPGAFHAWPMDAPEGMKADRTFLRERARQLIERGLE